MDRAKTQNTRADYRFKDFGRETITGNGNDVDANLEQHTVKVGLGGEF